MKVLDVRGGVKVLRISYVLQCSGEREKHTVYFLSVEIFVFAQNLKSRGDYIVGILKLIVGILLS